MVTVNVSSIIWAACAALFVARYLDRWVDRTLRLLELRSQIDPQQLPADTGASHIPDDLLAMVNAISTGVMESDELMRSQTVALLYEKAAEYGGDWDKVRAWSAVNLDADGGITS